MATSPPAPPPRLAALMLAAASAAQADGALPLPWLDPVLAAAPALDRAHALLLHGPAGAGHLAAARVLAQRRLCESRPPGQIPTRPCGHCDGCRLVQQRSHPDLRQVLPELLRHQLGWQDEDDHRPPKGDAKPSKDLKIDQVRRAIAWSQQTSGRGRGKVLLLHPGDALNMASGNALLKTLEEPPDGLQILLTSHDPERLLPTLRSRCQRLRLPLPAEPAARHWLAEAGLAEPGRLLAATAGSPLQAVDWAAQGVDAALLAALPARLADGDAAALAGLPLPLVIDLLLKLIHDAMCLAVGGAPRFLPGADWPATPAQAQTALVAWQQAVLRAARHAEHTWSAALLLEALTAPATQVWPAAARRPPRRPAPTLRP